MSTHDTHDIAELKSKIREVRFPMFTWQDEHGHLLMDSEHRTFKL